MKTLITAVAVFLISISSSFAQAYVNGTHYTTLNNSIQTEGVGAIEVREFFWYGSPNSQQANSLVQQWANRLASDVMLVQTPTIWNANMATHAAGFYTAQALGVLGRTHTAAYQAIQSRTNLLDTESSWMTFFARYGVPESSASNTFRSFNVNVQVQKSQSLFRAAQLNSVPAFIVDGTYAVTPASAGSVQNALSVVDFLIQKVRSEN